MRIMGRQHAHIYIYIYRFLLFPMAQIHKNVDVKVEVVVLFFKAPKAAQMGWIKKRKVATCS